MCVLSLPQSESMLGFWEILILLLFVGYLVVPFINKRGKSIKKRRPKEPRVIDIDDDNIEIMD